MIQMSVSGFVIAVLSCSAIAFFGGYQIGYGNGSQAEWKTLLKERGKIELEHQKYLDMKNCLRSRCYPGAEKYFDNNQYGFLTIVMKGREGDGEGQ